MSITLPSITSSEIREAQTPGSHESASEPLPSPSLAQASEIPDSFEMEESFLEGGAQIPGHEGGHRAGRSPAGTRCRWSEPGSSHPVKGKGVQLRWPCGQVSTLHTHHKRSCCFVSLFLWEVRV